MLKVRDLGHDLEEVKTLVDVHARITMVKEGLVQQELDHVRRIRELEDKLTTALRPHLDEHGYGGFWVEDVREVSEAQVEKESRSPKRLRLELQDLLTTQGDEDVNQSKGNMDPNGVGENVSRGRCQTRYVAMVPRKIAKALDLDDAYAACSMLLQQLVQGDGQGLTGQAVGKKAVISKIREHFTQVVPRLAVTTRRPKSLGKDTVFKQEPRLRDAVQGYLVEKEQLHTLQAMRRETCKPFIQQKRALQQRLIPVLEELERRHGRAVQIVTPCTLSVELEKQRYGVMLQRSPSRRKVKKLTLSMLYQALKILFPTSESLVAAPQLQEQLLQHIAALAQGSNDGLLRPHQEPGGEGTEGPVRVKVSLVQGRNDPRRKLYCKRLGELAVARLREQGQSDQSDLEDEEDEDDDADPEEGWDGDEMNANVARGRVHGDEDAEWAGPNEANVQPVSRAPHKPLQLDVNGQPSQMH